MGNEPSRPSEPKYPKGSKVEYKGIPNPSRDRAVAPTVEKLDDPNARGEMETLSLIACTPFDWCMNRLADGHFVKVISIVDGVETDEWYAPGHDPNHGVWSSTMQILHDRVVEVDCEDCRVNRKGTDRLSASQVSERYPDRGNPRKKVGCFRHNHQISRAQLVNVLKASMRFESKSTEELQQQVDRYMTNKGAVPLGKAPKYKVYVYDDPEDGSKPKVVKEKDADGSVKSDGSRYHVYMGWQIVKSGGPSSAAGCVDEDQSAPMEVQSSVAQAPISDEPVETGSGNYGRARDEPTMHVDGQTLFNSLYPRVQNISWLKNSKENAIKITNMIVEAVKGSPFVVSGWNDAFLEQECTKCAEMIMAHSLDP